MAITVLLIDDDPALRETLGRYLDRVGYAVLEAADAEGGLAAARADRPTVVLLDLHLPDRSGMDVLEDLVAEDAAVILLTGGGDIPTAVKAMQLGAEHFLTKPVDMPHLVAVIERAAEKVQLRRAVQLLRDRVGAPSLEGLLGVSPPMHALERQLALVAESERTTLLITGESGSGKGRVAEAVHHHSPRRDGPFVDLNCGGLTETFLDDELFGHERGSFTGARDHKDGLFEVANGGTLFLDEIGTLALSLQPKLLKVLETRRFRRIGGTREVSVDVRLIAASNVDLAGAVESGTFREDLYYRIGVTVVHLPPVRERTREDRIHLLERVMAELSQDFPRGPRELSAGALDRLLSYRWPGNVREMRNALEQAMIMAGTAQAVEVRHLPANVRQSGGRRRQVTLRDAERREIERVLRYHAGNRTRAARDLGISRVTLLKKIRDYGLES